MDMQMPQLDGLAVTPHPRTGSEQRRSYSDHRPDGQRIRDDRKRRTEAGMDDSISNRSRPTNCWPLDSTTYNKPNPPINEIAEHSARA